MLIADQLHFNVSWPREVFLNVDLIATEECFCFTLCRVHCFLHFCCRMHHFHSAATATECRFNCYWPTELGTEIGDLFCVGAKFRSSGNDRGSAAQCSLTARHFVTHFIDCFWWWSDEGNTHCGDCASEVGVLTEEAVARVHAISTAVCDGLQDGLGVEIALCCSLSAKSKCLVGETHMEGIAVEFGIHSDSGDTHFSGSTDDTDSDFAAVGDKDFLQHRCQYCLDGHPQCELIRELAYFCRT
ncbi:unannotated protein [freshwater metagenome]|uniref:Unannotated protein n=1 Tax=freshwater metagenome TaxID=449393 RepID=A0A6J6ICG2_9ZZZZ